MVLDTNVVSYIYRQDPLSEFYEKAVSGLEPVISFQTLEESWHGGYLDGWGRTRFEELERYLGRG